MEIPTFSRILANDPAFSSAMEIYIEAFPQNERHLVEKIRERVLSEKLILIIGKLDDTIVLMALFWPLEGTRFILFDYMGVRKNYRNKGIGSTFLKDVFHYIDGEDRSLLLEVEDPNFGSNMELRSSRVRFYLRQGALLLGGVRYVLPPLSGEEPTEMVLMIIPGKIKEKLSGEELKDAIKKIYSDIYGRSETDPFLSSFINDVPNNIVLMDG